jgi:hypothetical protein
MAADGDSGALVTSGEPTGTGAFVRLDEEAPWVYRDSAPGGTTSVALDGRRAYVAWRRDRTVWRFDEDDSPTRIAGTGEWRSPRQIVVGAAALVVLVVLGWNFGVVGALVGLANVLAVTLAGLARYFRDGVPATSARLAAPAAVAVDEAGRVYIAEEGSSRVRIVDTDGTISTAVGRAFRAGRADGGPTSSACLSRPTGLAVDQSGSLYVADAGNRSICRTTPEGTISTVAGGSSAPVAPDGAPARTARLGRPMGLAIAEDGTLFVADKDNNRVRAIDVDGVIRTVAGSGAAGSGGTEGPARSAELRRPYDVAVVGGTLFIADTGNRRICEVDLFPRYVSR